MEHVKAQYLQLPTGQRLPIIDGQVPIYGKNNRPINRAARIIDQRQKELDALAASAQEDLSND